MSKPKPYLHLCRSRPNRFGGITTTSLCGRLRTLDDGMNLTDNPNRVTCKLCKKAIAAWNNRREEGKP